MIAELPWVFRLKTPEHQEAIRNFLSKDAVSSSCLVSLPLSSVTERALWQVRGQRVSIQRIRR
eukprot:131443-Rhodomonas_salina.2